MSVIEPQSTRRGTFVTSQMKLQFAQDYQAREGVPLYNNNVRVAGALDRQRSLEASTSGLGGLGPRAGGASSETFPLDESAGDADESRLVANRMPTGAKTGGGRTNDESQKNQNHGHH